MYEEVPVNVFQDPGRSVIDVERLIQRNCRFSLTDPTCIPFLTIP